MWLRQPHRWAFPKKKSVGQPSIETNNINKLIKNDTQYGYDNPTVELSQTMDNFQQQQTGRLL